MWNYIGLIVIIIGMVASIIIAYKGQKAASKAILEIDQNWKPNNFFMSILWSLFKYKR